MAAPEFSQGGLLLKECKDPRTKRRIGVDKLLDHLEGRPLDPRDAIFATCAFCNGMHQDKDDDGEPYSCRMSLCPFYAQWFPYKRALEPACDADQREWCIKDVRSRKANRVGREEYQLFLQGKQISPIAAIRAYCWRCTCGWIDEFECGIPHCPCYPHRPYQKGIGGVPET